MEKIKEWFDKNKTFGLKTPEGWYGRPYDNHHNLSGLFNSNNRIIIETDELNLFVITQSSELMISIEENDLVINNFKTLVWDLLTYIDLKSEIKIFKDGELRFVSYNY